MRWLLVSTGNPTARPSSERITPATCGFSSTPSTNQSSSMITLGSCEARTRSTSSMVIPGGIHDGFAGVRPSR
jgi:hypothetical protein